MYAQKEERKNIREGNKLYKKEKYKEAEDAYRKALNVNSQSVEGFYNMGNALYRQLSPSNNGQMSDDDKKKIATVIDQYKAAVALSQNKTQKAMAWHNLGNMYLISGDFQQGANAYKNSLLNNPFDNETRYNYALAKELLKQQQEQQQNQNQDKNDQNQDKKDQNQEQKNQDQDKDKKDNNQNQNENQQQQQDKMSKENAQQILEAIMQDEQQTQEKVQKAIKIQQKKQPEKDW